MYASFNARAVGLPGLSARETIEIAASAGFDAVDLMVRDLVNSGDDPRDLRSRMDDLGLRGGAFPCPVDWRDDEAAFLDALNAVGPILEAARILGLSTTGTWVRPELPEGKPDRAGIASEHLRRLGKLARRLGDEGIRLGLEVIGVESFRTGRGSPFITRLSEIDRELSGIWAESPFLGILLDFFHLYAANEPIEAGLAWGVDRICWVHVADLPPGAPEDRSRIVDANRGLPGENGAIDVRGFLARLSLEGYHGPITAEPLANCQSLAGLEPREIASRVKKSLEAVWPQS